MSTNRITKYLAPLCTGDYSCECPSCENCEPLIDFAEAVRLSDTVQQITPADIRATCDANGWIPIGDGYYHRDVGTVRCDPPEEDEAESERQMARENCFFAGVCFGFVVCAFLVWWGAR